MGANRFEFGQAAQVSEYRDLWHPVSGTGQKMVGGAHPTKYVQFFATAWVAGAVVGPRLSFTLASCASVSRTLKGPVMTRSPGWRPLLIRVWVALLGPTETGVTTA